jgi:predicted nucleic acid-binding protein
MSRIFWDTNLFIYLLEGSDARAKQVAELRREMLQRGDQLLTSALTLGEVLVKPIEQRDDFLRQKFEEAITAASIVIPFDVEAAGLYARLRLDRSLRPPDAIQLACAGAAGVDLFITNDARFQSKRVPGIQFIVPLERAPL